MNAGSATVAREREKRKTSTRRCCPMALISLKEWRRKQNEANALRWLFKFAQTIKINIYIGKASFHRIVVPMRWKLNL